ncbi:MAG: histidine phosphatase family protein [Fimbriimonas sp.]|nr:histidine phosphatase family protein [Fimbriimonas sp.]
MRLLLVRHGQTSWNDSGRAQGHTDIPLDPVGMDQARRVGEALADYPIERIITSDLVRSRDTAKAVADATGANLEVRIDLRERCFGEWEGLPFTAVTQNLQDRAATHGISAQEVRPPSGESFLDVWDRLEPLHTDLRQAEGLIAVVSHGGSLSILLAKLLKGTLDTSRAFRFANTGITELQRRMDGLFLITRYNDTSHLASDRVLSGSLDGVSR